MVFRRFSLHSNSNSSPAPPQQPQRKPRPTSSSSSPAGTSTSPNAMDAYGPSGDGDATFSGSDFSLLSLHSALPTTYGASTSSTSAPSGSRAPPAPPPYQAVPAAAPQSDVGARSTGAGRQPARRSSIEDRLAPLGKYDLVLLVDDSPSMVDYWTETGEALMGVVEQCTKYDKDGIDVLFMNNDDRRLENITDPALVARAFREVEPFGSTPTGMVLDEVLRDYVERVEGAKATKARVKPLLLLVLTDGRADDPDMVKDIIVEMAQRLDVIRAPPYQLGLQFIQIGTDPEARAFLQELDDDLKPQLGVRDMVDCTPYEGRITPEFILKAALGSVNKALDG